MNELLNSISEKVLIQLSVSLLIILILLLARSISRKVVVSRIIKYNMDIGRKYLINKIINLIILIIGITLLAVVWDVTFQGVAVYFTSFFAVAGIGLFAQWSILSNITASVILFFNYPFKIGSTIRIKDGDNSVTGIITNISMFVIHITTDEGDDITYPNILALQKPIQIIKV